MVEQEVRDVREKVPQKQQKGMKEAMIKHLQAVIMGKMSPDETLATLLSPNWTQTSHGLLSVKVSLCNMSHKEEFVVETAAVVYIILIVS